MTTPSVLLPFASMSDEELIQYAPEHPWIQEVLKRELVENKSLTVELREEICALEEEIGDLKMKIESLENT